MSDLRINKTYKLYIGGNFVRSESGRVFPQTTNTGDVVQLPKASRKDLRNAVTAAGKASSGWVQRDAYNRAQIIYRIAEMLEERSSEFIQHLITEGYKTGKAAVEIQATIDRLVYFAGWADKYEQLLSSVNPVSGPYLVISKPEPIGIVGLVAPKDTALLGFVTRLCAAIITGNTTVIITDTYLLTRLSFAEILHTSDVPAGVINILTGYKEELLPVLAAHKGVQGIDLGNSLSKKEKTQTHQLAVGNVKNVIEPTSRQTDWSSATSAMPTVIETFTETKTIWSPIGQ